jgi:hypothetical protein
MRLIEERRRRAVERDGDLAHGERELAVLDPEAAAPREKSPVTALKPKPIISVT